MSTGLRSLLVLFFAVGTLCAQSNEGREAYAVRFKSKVNIAERLKSPEAFLTPKALERRAKSGISLKARDLPIDSNRLLAVRSIASYTGPVSKWLNSVYIEATPEEVLAILELEFVQSVLPAQGAISALEDQAPTYAFYGQSLDQVEQINLNEGPHRNPQTRGDGMLIAVLDAGFVGGNVVNFNDNNPVIFTKNYVDGGINVYQGSSHGFNVLSTMAALKEGTFVGTAPNAQYALFKTEAEGSETPQEMYNWVAAAEFADSMGADLINSSLGYYTFDDPSDDYSIADLDGKTSVITLGALEAARTGMLVITSAGNEGQTSWGKITFPADADSIIAVGSVNQYNIASAFSSRGYSSDGRIKPNVAARGEGAALLVSGGAVAYGNGTSFSSPILCGAAASLWSAVPEANAQQVLQAIEVSASHYYTPNNSIGRGIPNFAFALQYLNQVVSGAELAPIIYPNPFPDYLELFFPDSENLAIDLRLYDMNNRMVAEKSFEPRRFQALWAPGDHIAPGMYFLQVSRGSKTSFHRITKLL
jgi:hypothetical protein